MSWLSKFGTLTSQTVNALLLGGNPDQSISSRAYTESQLGSDKWFWVQNYIDGFLGEGHCHRAYLSDIQFAREIEKVP